MSDLHPPLPRACRPACWLLAVLAAWILLPFLSAIAWACILAHATWPVHARIARSLPGGARSHALVSTCLVTLAGIVPALVLAWSIRSNLAIAMSWVNANLDRDVRDVLDTAARVPWVGPLAHDWFDGQASELTSVRDLLHQWSAQVLAGLIRLVGDIGRNAFRFALTVCFLFLLYLEGDRIAAAVRAAGRRSMGEQADAWLRVCAQANRAMMVSVLLVALIQGLVATTGYWLVGFRAPLLLGFATAVTSLVPVVGTLLVWGPASVVLLSMGEVWPAVGLVAWGTLLIHPIDNVLRPWLVSGAVRLPFLLVFLGVVGGLAAAGLVGIVLGPMILAVGWEACRTALATSRATD